MLVDGSKLEVIRSAFCSTELALSEACPAAVVWHPPKQKPSPGMWYGIFVHRFLEYVNSRGHAAAMDYIASKFDPSKGRSHSANLAYRCCAAIDPATVPRGAPEVALAHDAAGRTARRLLRNDRADAEREMFGKADLVTDDDDFHPEVVDYKCGPNPPDPDGSTQLLGLAESLRCDLGWRGAVRTTILGVRSDGALLPRTKLVTAGELDDYADRARRAQLRVVADRAAAAEGEDVPVRPGDHCRRCHLRVVCGSSAHKVW